MVLNEYKLNLYKELFSNIYSKISKNLGYNPPCNARWMVLEEEAGKQPGAARVSKGGVRSAPRGDSQVESSE